MTQDAVSSAPRRRRLAVRIVNIGALYALYALLAAALLFAGMPGWTLAALLSVFALAFLFDVEDDLDRMFWTQIAHSMHARALMRKPIRRIPIDQCPPQLLAAVRRFDQHANPEMVAETDTDRMAVLDWTTWDEPQRDYYCLIAVDAAGAMSAMTFFSKWPKVWGSRR